MADFRVPFTVVQDAFGLPATVTRPAPDDTPLAATVVWVTPQTIDSPGGSPFGRREASRSLGIARAQVPTVPRGTRVQVAEEDGGTVQWWQVDELEIVEGDHVRAIVVPLEPGT